MELPLPDLSATERLGAALADLLRPGDAILLEGPLGAGKSMLARALIRAALRDRSLEVPSPTFTLVQSYEGPQFTIHHLDLWRFDLSGLGGPSALSELGWDEMREDVVLVEWPDRLGDSKPHGALRIALRAGEQAGGRHARLGGWPASRFSQWGPSG